MSLTIRPACPEDASAIYDMIYELAVYEKAPQEVVTTPMRSARRFLARAAIPKR